MKPDPAAEARRWLAQAEHDLADARFLTANSRHHLACYLAQQSSGKALKAVLYAHGEVGVVGHSAGDLAVRATTVEPRLTSLASRAASLDKYYIPTRYPNGLPGGIPSEAYGPADAALAISDADAVVAACREVLGSP